MGWQRPSPCGHPLLCLPALIALLHLLIDPACTGVFEALPLQLQQRCRPPMPPEAPLFGRYLWRQVLLQGGCSAWWRCCWCSGRSWSSACAAALFSLLLLGGAGLAMGNGAVAAAAGHCWADAAAGMAPLLGEWALPLLDLVGVFSLFAVRRRR